MITSHPRSIWRLASATSFLALTLCALLLIVSRARADTITTGDQIAAPEAPGRISGRVTDESGVPLAGVSVNLYAYPFESPVPSFDFPSFYSFDRSTTTDVAGNYTFTLLSSSVYRVGFYDPVRPFAWQFYSGTTFARANELTVMGSNLTGINGVLRPAAAISGTLSFTMPSPYFGASFALYEKVNNQWKYAAFLGQSFAYDSKTRQASFVVGKLAAGVYRLCAITSNYGFNYPRVSGCYGAATGGSSDLNTLVEQGADITVTTGATLTGIHIAMQLIPENPIPADAFGISGRVTNPSGESLPGIQVTPYISGEFGEVPVGYAVTNYAGEYYLPAYFGQSVRLRFVDQNGDFFAQYYNQIDVINGNEAVSATLISDTANRRVRDINARLTQAGQIYGAVLYPDGFSTGYTEVGVYRLVNGQWILNGSDNYYMPVTVQPNGEFRIGGLRPGVYRVFARTGLSRYDTLQTFFGGPSLETASDIVIGLSEVRQGVNIVMGQGQFDGAISGVVMAGGTPRGGIKVELLRSTNFGPPQTPVLYVTTNKDGQYTLTDLLTGSYALRFSDGSDTYATIYHDGKQVYYGQTPLTITGASTLANINVNLTQAGELGGSIRNYNGRLLSQASVVVYQVNSTNNPFPDYTTIANTTTDSTGEFRVKGLLPGVYQVNYFHPDLPGFYAAFGEYDDAQNVYVPSDIVVSSGQTARADMSVPPTALDDTAEPEDRRVIYLPIAAK